MFVKFTITGTIDLPEGTQFSDQQMNLLVLPDGSTITVQPILEHNTSEHEDNHRNLDTKAGIDIGVTLEFDTKEIIEEVVRNIVKISDFKIGDEFVFIGMDVRNRVTDIGSRTIIFIRLDQEDKRNYNGPPYSIVEHVLDEDEINGVEIVRKTE